MNIRLQPLVLALLLGAAAAILVTGCNRQEANPSGESAPAETTMGTELDDTVLTTKVKSALLADENVKGLEIKVETRKGRVLLSGFVDDKVRADHAISVARAVEGVTGVDNGMTIKDGNASVGNTLDDSVLTAKVKSALMSDAGIRSGDISVATRKGEVQLSGFVDSQEQIERAVLATRSIEGVQLVVNEMSVKK
jgi:hyperosmotically inducible protein